MNKDKVIAVCFLAFITVFSIITTAKVGFEIVTKMQSKMATVQASATAEGNNTTAESEQEKDPVVTKETLSGKIRLAINKVDSLYNSNIFEKNEFIELNGFTQRLLGKKVIDDADPEMTVIKDNVNFLYFITNDKPLDITNQANNVIKLNQYCTDKGIDFLYVQAPFKITGETGQLPNALHDYSESMADNMCLKLKENNVNLLDVRELMQTESMNYEDHFYKTDHHWTFETGFWAYGKVIDELNRSFHTQLNTKYCDVVNYDALHREKCFVGSQGKRVGKYYTDIDDITLYIPKFQTDYQYYLYDTAGKLVKERKGNFYNTLINTADFESDDVYVSKYDSFLETINETRIINNKADNDLKVLFIKDSFAKPVAGYLSLNVKETRLLDLRTYEGSTYDYIKEYQPDIVIILYNASFLKIEEYYNFES